jgi:hypothetical protein
LAKRASLIGTIGAVGLPVALGLLFGAISVLLQHQYDFFVVYALLLVATISFSIFGALPAFLLSFGAIRIGFAGWSVAIASGALVSMVVFQTVVWNGFSMQGDPLAVGAGSGSVFGALFWLSGRLSTPLAYVLETTDG